MRTISKLLTLILGLISFAGISAQESSVYLHTDRSYYIPGEPVLFRAYFLNKEDNRKISVNDTLHLVLLDQFAVEVASGLFPVGNSMISGNIDLPDFLTEGNYILIAYTNTVKTLSPDKIFSRIIEIRKSVDNYLTASLSLSDAVYESAGEFSAQIRFSGTENIPVPASYSYQLTGNKEEILNGNNKANSDGIANIKFKLPKFDNKETLKLFVIGSSRGTKISIGVIIPTHFNSPDFKIKTSGNPSANVSKNLNIQLKALNTAADKNDKFRMEISVTDDKGIPAMLNLSVSVSNLIQHQLPYENDNILNAGQNKYQSDQSSDPDIKEYFTEYLVQKTQSPGTPFIVQEKNNTRKLLKSQGSANKKTQPGYPGDSNTLFWGPEIMTDNSGKAIFSFTNNGKTQEVLISVDGLAVDGARGSSTIQFSVK
jgi:hypothetical protein